MRNYGIFANFPIAKTRMVELHICSGWHLMKMFIRIEQIGCYFSRCTLATEDALPYPFAAELSGKASGVIGCIRFLIEGFIHGYYFFLVVFEEVGAGGALCGQFGAFTGVESGLDIKDQVGDLLRGLFKDLVGIDDSVLQVVGVGVGHDDDGGSSIDLIEIEEASLLLGQFHILAE
jgi:hypothetical protein